MKSADFQIRAFLLVFEGPMSSLVFTHFRNDGFGWICGSCEEKSPPSTSGGSRSRLMREGEAESKNPTLSSEAIAKWADRENKILTCPRCGTTEQAAK